jgi:hypothetical protein
LSLTRRTVRSRLIRLRASPQSTISSG